jgi:hypothetical protein
MILESTIFMITYAAGQQHFKKNELFLPAATKTTFEFFSPCAFAIIIYLKHIFIMQIAASSVVMAKAPLCVAQKAKSCQMPAPMAFKSASFTSKPLRSTRKMQARAMSGKLW